jgi:hypothetical protein
MKKRYTQRKIDFKQGKMDQLQSVYKENNKVSKSIKETLMSTMLITSLSAITLGILALFAHLIGRKAARQPILIEQRKIIYRRRP